MGHPFVHIFFVASGYTEKLELFLEPIHDAVLYPKRAL